MDQVYQFLAHLGWPTIVVSVLYVMSEALVFFPNIEANSTVQLLINIIKELRVKLSLTPANTTPTQQ